MALNNLGLLYSDTQRLKEAEAVYTECLSSYRQLAKENAAAFLPDVATTLNNLGIVYRTTDRPREAATAYTECLTIRRQLMKTNPTTYADELARSLVGMMQISKNSGDPVHWQMPVRV